MNDSLVICLDSTAPAHFFPLPYFPTATPFFFSFFKMFHVYNAIVYVPNWKERQLFEKSSHGTIIHYVIPSSKVVRTNLANVWQIISLAVFSFYFRFEWRVEGKKKSGRIVGAEGILPEPPLTFWCLSNTSNNNKKDPLPT